MILWHLGGGTLRFDQIHGLISSVTQCMLTTSCASSRRTGLWSGGSIRLVIEHSERRR